VSVAQVTDANFQDYLAVNVQGWSLDSTNQSAVKKLRTMMDHPKCRSFVAYRDSAPIGCSGLILREGYGYLVGAVVLEKFRGAGAYRALIQARLDALLALGLPFGVTQAREATSAPILEKLGFETVFQARMYLFEP